MCSSLSICDIENHAFRIQSKNALSQSNVGCTEKSFYLLIQFCFLYRFRTIIKMFVANVRLTIILHFVLFWMHRRFNGAIGNNRFFGMIYTLAILLAVDAPRNGIQSAHVLTFHSASGRFPMPLFNIISTSFVHFYSDKTLCIENA